MLQDDIFLYGLKRVQLCICCRNMFIYFMFLLLIQQIFKYLSADSVDEKPKSRSSSVLFVCNIVNKYIYIHNDIV